MELLIGALGVPVVMEALGVDEDELAGIRGGGVLVGGEVGERLAAMGEAVGWW